MKKAFGAILIAVILIVCVVTLTVPRRGLHGAVS